MSRVLANAENQITYSFESHTGAARGVDVVKYKLALADITAHSDGVVIDTMTSVRAKGKTDADGAGTGNYILIAHENLVTKYCHLKYGSIKVKKGDKVSKGQMIASMGQTGVCSGAHLHFEVRDYYPHDPNTLTHEQLNNPLLFTFINPTNYLDSDLPNGISIDYTSIAKAVIAGKWGNGAIRKKNLEAAGYDYEKVQKKVEELLVTKTSTTKTTTSVKTLKQGDKVTLKDAKKYSSSRGACLGTISGAFYIYDNYIVNGKRRITTKAEYCGKAGYVTCWAEVR